MNFSDVTRIEWRQCDLENLRQTDAVAKELADELDKLDGLICNAGLGVGVYNETVDGLDSHMQVNHISQAHLALTLLPLLQKTPNPRLVFQSSELHRACPSSTVFSSISEINTNIEPTNLYARSKLAQILFLHELVRRIKAGQFGSTTDATGEPWINATHPGGVQTDQQQQVIEAYGTLRKLDVAVTRPFMKDALDEGCRPALFAATSEDIVKETMQGQYIVPDRKVTEPNKQARDEKLAANLWALKAQTLRGKLGNLPYEM